MQLNVDTVSIPAEQRRAAANSPEVHAAAILAAKDYILSMADTIEGIDSSALAQTIAFHAALIMQSYLTLVGSDDLAGQLALGKFLSKK
jgi:hypothetical protein